MDNKSLSERSREELLEIIKSLKKQKKFGLVWEDKPEKVATECKQKLPVVKEEVNKVICDTNITEPTNIIIEGDNYHALSVLNYTHAGKIDVIYIDPPYNTGAKNWKYNNSYVDSEDSYRHSKWISMMDKRLRLAKNLLSELGSMIIAIDENELAHTLLLVKEVFGVKYNIDCIAIVHNPGGIQGANFSYCHEYAIFVYPNISHYINPEKRDDYIEQPLRDWGKENSKRTGSPNCFFPIICKDRQIVGFGDVPEENYHPTAVNEYRSDELLIWPIDGKGIERRWRFARNSIHKIIDELVVVEKSGVMDIHRRKQIFPRKTVWDKSTYNANIYGSQLLSKMIKTKFDFPKSLYLVKDCISACEQSKDGIILDFFAGSGTTGQAVLELNREDGGHRQFILCTNNENQIAEEVTYPRIKAVVKGYGDTEGIPANVRYFKTDFVEKDDTLDKLRRKLSPACEDMIRIREGAFDKVIDEDKFKVYRNSRGLTAVVFDRFELSGYIARIEELKTDTPVHLYVFSYTNYGRLDEISDGLKHTYESQPIPEGVLEIYKRIFNQGGKK